MVRTRWQGGPLHRISGRRAHSALIPFYASRWPRYSASSTGCVEYGRTWEAERSYLARVSMQTRASSTSRSAAVPANRYRRRDIWPQSGAEWTRINVNVGC